MKTILALICAAAIAIADDTRTYDEIIFELEEADRKSWQWEEAQALGKDPAVLKHLENIKRQTERHQPLQIRSSGQSVTYPEGFPDVP